MSTQNFLKILIFSLVSFFLTGCLSSSDSTSEKEIKTMEAVQSAFLQLDMALVVDLSSARTLVGAKQVTKYLDEEHEKEGHVHDDEKEEGHKFVLIIKATPNKNGEYSQKTLKLGDSLYFHKVLYTATLKDNRITVSQSLAQEGSPDRKDVKVEKAVLKQLARTTGGRIEGESIILN